MDKKCTSKMYTSRIWFYSCVFLLKNLGLRTLSIQLILKHGSNKSFPYDNFIKKLPLKFIKAGRVWSGGARETHWARSHNWVTVSKTKQSLRSPCFSRIPSNSDKSKNYSQKISVIQNQLLSTGLKISLSINKWKINIRLERQRKVF